MNGKTVMACIEAAHATLKEHTDEIAALDQQIGDGDHIFNLLRGADALLGMRADIEADAFAPALDLAASKLLSTVGGSSGPLFYSLLHGMAKASAESGDMASVQEAARIFAAGVDAVAQRGKAGLGSKTMMDVLIPVASRLAELADDDAPPEVVLDTLPEVAEQSMLATRDMLATKGRASFLGERSRGHIDPGARSSQLMIDAVCARLAQDRA
ncbi:MULTISPECIES: dihydroxyacetone kinase subunit DhaL [Paraburkholderia]|jgi:dihydroxyacetone kinase-like protein|uniref:dihydroxyacetone kinase subunit DhaL n=1 Tax=Paraburkholderia TaxID=1822464 RepID=UPI001CB28B65|nr:MULTISPECIES: dihydroxyacetone kinase subunit DhaL [Paraburkholderia]GJH03964.1 dihydroxyacetone kinase subunit L [Paraburkholderia terrae]CAG9266452.1 Phosphoenolpyruvate-dihydroxyacetone phosphotransferase, ADP-binding subunit DhaL [Paraburkholderia caribensis]